MLPGHRLEVACGADRDTEKMRRPRARCPRDCDSHVASWFPVLVLQLHCLDWAPERFRTMLTRQRFFDDSDANQVVAPNIFVAAPQF
jgi:hypothetical protein